MADREFWLPGPQPEPTTQVPTVSETWVERQGRVSQFNSRIDIFAEVSKHVDDIAQEARIGRDQTDDRQVDMSPASLTRVGWAQRA